MQLKSLVCLALFAGLAGCASLPSSGPTGGEIVRSASSPASGPIRIVEVRTIADLPVPASAALPGDILPELPPRPTDMIGPGDVLDIHIFEAGVTLFGSGGAAALGDSGSNPAVQVQTLPPSRVDDDGDIRIPYAGRLHVAGRTIEEVERMVQRSLRGLSQNPQVEIDITNAITNSVIVNGEVAKPGRLVLETNREKLSDVIALAGGYRGSAKDLSLRVERSGHVAQMRLSELLENPQADVLAYPGDRVTLLQKPWSFSVLGASGRVDQLPFNRSKVSLMEGVAQAGGANASYGDPAAIFVFRYDAGGKPVVYHFNMMTAGAYFLAQKFMLRDNDVIYIGTASANRPSKLIQLISQLFSPLVVVENGARAF
jgi:polysaccharide export outer membrane protein